MTTDNKTLADVQPGGRVRLGDQALRVFSAGRWTYDGTGQSFSHEEMDAAAFVVYRDAALSAQPSPGGQVEDAVEQLRVQLAGCGVVAMSNTRESLNEQMPDKGAYGWSESLQQVWESVLREIHQRERAEAAEQALEMAASSLPANVLQQIAGFFYDGPYRNPKMVDVMEAALAARQPVYVQGSDELRARTEGERAAYMEGLEEGKKIAARQAVGKIDEAAVLRRAAAVLDMWEGDSNQTGYMGDFKDAQAILEVLAQNAAQSAQAVDLGQSIPSELAPVAAALKRFGDCAEDSGSEGCDIGRDWFDALTTIGLLSRTQRSPAVWTMTEEGERLLALIDSKAVGNG